MIRLIEKFFTKSMTEAVTIPRSTPTALLAEIARQAYVAAEKRWDEAKLAVRRYKMAHPRLDSIRVIAGGGITRVNEMESEPLESRRLHRIEREAKAARDEALRAMLRAEGKL